MKLISMTIWNSLTIIGFLILWIKSNAVAKHFMSYVFIKIYKNSS